MFLKIMTELPRDVILKITSYMDIDTRRALGIYCKLRIPDEIKSKLEAVIPHPTRLIFEVYSRVSLGPINNERYMYAINSDFGLMKSDVHSRTGFNPLHSRTGLTFYHPSVLDPNYKNIMLKSPLLQTYVEHYGTIIMEQPSY